MLKNLIQIKSTSGGEADIQKYIFDYLSALHLNPIYIGGNVVAKIIGKSSKIALIFNAHVDTVPPGDLSKWKHDPYVVTIYKGKIYGLGASDEKATVEIQLQLAKYFSSQMPGCDIWLTFVEGEETDGHGTKLFLDWFSEKYMDSYNQTSAILGEPTGLKKIEIAHKGNLFLSVTTFGKSGHGSAPHKPSENAVLNMYEVINNLTSLSKSWQYKYINKVLGYPSIALATSIIAGDPKVPNKYPDSCTATFDVRTVPEMNDRALSEIKSIVKMKDVEFKCLYQPIGCGYTFPSYLVPVLC